MTSRRQSVFQNTNSTGTDAFNHDNIIKHPNIIKTIGLVRVPNHNRVACATAVARAKSIVLPPYIHPRHPDYVLHKNSTTAKNSRALFPGAILGRTSKKSAQDSHFVDLGIDTETAGISRKHLRVLMVRGWNGHRGGVGMRGGGGGGGRSIAEGTNNGQPSLCSESVASKSCAERTVGGCTGGDANASVNGNTVVSVNADSHSLGRNTSKASAPSLIVQVIPVANSRISTNGVNFYRTKGDIRRNVFLAQGQKCTLRVGDAIEFYSNPMLYFCVVELNILRDGVEEKVDVGGGDEKKVGVAVGNGPGIGDVGSDCAEGKRDRAIELKKEKE